jgi:general stress protein 26
MSLLHHPGDTAPDAVERVIELLHEFDTATLVTHKKDGRLHGRPMAIAQIESDGTLWFVSDETSQKTAEIENDSRVLIVLQGSKRFVMANGEVLVVKNHEKLRELWTESHRLWFQDQNDPNIVLLRFSPTDAEYWDTSGVRGLKYVFRAAKAYLSGETTKKEQDPELHGKVGS